LMGHPGADYRDPDEKDGDMDRIFHHGHPTVVGPNTWYPSEGYPAIAVGIFGSQVGERVAFQREFRQPVLAPSRRDTANKKGAPPKGRP
jgi:hypothetical protein